MNNTAEYPVNNFKYRKLWYLGLLGFCSFQVLIGVFYSGYCLIATYSHYVKVCVIGFVCTPSTIRGCDFPSSLYRLWYLLLSGKRCLWQQRGQSLFSFTCNTFLQRLAWLQSDLGQQFAILFLVLPTTNPLTTSHTAADHVLLLGGNEDRSCK